MVNFPAKLNWIRFTAASGYCGFLFVGGIVAPLSRDDLAPVKIFYRARRKCYSAARVDRLKLILEIVTVVLTFAIMGGCGLASWFTYDSMIADLNRKLSPGEKIPVIFTQLTRQNWKHDVLREHREQFPASKLHRRLYFSFVSSGIAVGLFWLELALFKPFSIFH